MNVNNLVLQDIINILHDSKSTNIVVINIQHKSNIADYIIVSSGYSSIHIQSIARLMFKKLKHFILKYKKECLKHNEWIAIDLQQYIVHIMTENIRNFYNLEDFWK